MHKRIYCWTMACFLVLATSSTWVTAAASATANGKDIKFAEEVAKFTQSDATNPPPKGAILFVGSSSIRMWKNVRQQMAPMPVINRGFGGSRTWEVLHYMDQIVYPYEPKVIVFYCGTNDAQGGEPAEAIAARQEEFSKLISERWPRTHIIFLAACRAPSRRAKWDVMNEANARLAAHCKAQPRRHYIDINPSFFTPGTENPKMEMFLKDQLHFNDQGYVELTRVVRPVVEKVWQEAQRE